MIDDKQKLLYLMRLLREETDPAHPMNAAQISEKMEIQYECSYLLPGWRRFRVYWLQGSGVGREIIEMTEKLYGTTTWLTIRPFRAE
jgi:hypothetical protein